MESSLVTALAAVVLCGSPFAQGSDSCASAQPIAGTGLFDFDNTVATTDGSGQAACYKFGTSQIDADVWFEWTAPASGDFVVTTCSLATNDTKIAIYDGTDCVTSSAIACNDDAFSGVCGLQSEVIAFGLTGGSSYLIRIGSFPGGSQGAGQFAVELWPAPPPANDDCANAELIVGCGSFAYDTTDATEDGLGDALCYKFGTSGIDHDVWYSWTAPSTATYTVDTCAGATSDTKIAVYEDLGVCPPSPALDCNDDTCGLASTIQWNGTAGQNYLIRIGAFPSGPGGSGFFELTSDHPNECDGLLVDLASFRGGVIQGGSVYLTWETASEVNNAGFNLYRAPWTPNPPEGPPVGASSINPALIPAVDSLQGGSYRWTDSSTVTGHAYHYWLEDIDVFGQAAMHGPIAVR